MPLHYCMLKLNVKIEEKYKLTYIESYFYYIQMAEVGYHCYAPDWLGYGFSERPQPVYDFSYTGI